MYKPATHSFHANDIVLAFCTDGEFYVSVDIAIWTLATM
jgi:hypothetical protein